MLGLLAGALDGSAVLVTDSICANGTSSPHTVNSGEASFSHLDSAPPMA
jgi:hypothetical protein